MASNKRTPEEEANDAYKTLNDNQSEYDKQLLALSSGFLAVSLAFIKDVVPLTHAGDLWMLYFSWIFLGLCVIGVLFSYQFSIHGLFKAKDYWESKDRNPANFPYGHATAIKWVNWVSGVLFCLGVSLLVTFVILNIRRETSMAHAQDGAFIKTPAGDLVQKGSHIKAPPQPPPAPQPAPAKPASGQGKGDKK